MLRLIAGGFCHNWFENEISLDRLETSPAPTRERYFMQYVVDTQSVWL